MVSSLLDAALNKELADHNHFSFNAHDMSRDLGRKMLLTLCCFISSIALARTVYCGSTFACLQHGPGSS